MKTYVEPKWDDWQKKVLNTKGNLCICAGRQVGKSTIISKDAGDYAMRNRGKEVMIIASVERQALLLFEKVLSYIYMKDKRLIKGGKDRPTKHELKLTNGCIIRCLPTGDSGYGIRGHTIDRLYADEAHFIKEAVWDAVTPMLITTGGDIVLLSTPFGTEGYFYRCYHDKGFTSIHVNTEEVAKGREDPQRENMLAFLKAEKERMSRLSYQQEYLGMFTGGIKRFFSDELIDLICTVENHIPVGKKFQGIDVARMGGDEVVLTSLDLHKKRLTQFDMEIPEQQTLTDTTRLIIHKDKKINHKKIYIDATGMGWGVFDPLSEDKQTRRKVVAIENSKKTMDKERGKKTATRRPTMKEDLYYNLLNLMETDKIKLFKDPRVKQSLRSIQCDIGDGMLKIYGNYSHIVEALIRAAWCIKDKTLNIYVF